jgi:signal transduction histidine kinase
MAVIMIFSLTSTVTRVNRLARKVKKVESGNLELPIDIDGNDEITSLANDVNSMRNTIVDKMTKERQAWEANTGLITAMSHDIRTPLTVMLGYLDLMEIQNENSDNDEYIAACKENALRLKALSDDMFSYFLVFGQNDRICEGWKMQSSSIIEHMIAEHTILLEENGYRIERVDKIPEVKIKIEQVYFSRVIDNIFSNIGKYADKSTPIVIDSYINDGNLIISFENAIPSGESRAESNGIGLKTCSKILEKMGGRFEASQKGDVFVATVCIPVAQR